MGNKPSTAAAPVPPVPLTTRNSNNTNTNTNTNTNNKNTMNPNTLSTARTSTAAPITSAATKTTTTAPTTTADTKITPTTATTARTTTTTTTTTTNATTTAPIIHTINWTGLTAKAKENSTIPTSTESTPKPSFYSVVQSVTSEADPEKRVSSAYSHWYKYTKFDQKKRDQGKTLWYMSPPVTTSDTVSQTTSTLTMTTARISSEPKEVSNLSSITAIPSFQLRSTAVYSPPHGDRILSGRNELINTDTSVFKYYLPENRSKPTSGIHTKATMYQMDTHSKQTPLPTHLSAFTTKNIKSNTNVTGDNASLPIFVSRGLQTDLEAQPMNSSSTQMRYYEKQQPNIVPVSVLSDHVSPNSGFYHLSSADTPNQPVLPPIEKTPVWLNDQPHLSATSSFPSYPPAPPLPPTLPAPATLPRTSILKNSSTVLSQDISNPLSEQTHDKVLKITYTYKNTKDGIYRVKKVHVLEKNDPNYRTPAVSFNLPPSTSPRTKASQSILRSEKFTF